MTDNSRSKGTAIVLGGTLPHCELVVNLKNRGYYVALIDYNKNPPAKKFSDKHYQESTLDIETVYNIALSENASLVISTCVDQANLVACIVGERLKLPLPYSSEMARIVTNKVAMKSLMLEQGISTSNFRKFESLQEIEDLKLNFPLIVKPVDSNSSKGVRKVSDRNEMLVFAQIALGLSGIGKAIVEEYVEGVEIGIDCIVNEGDVEVVMVKERKKINGIEDQQIYGCFWPMQLDFLEQPKYKKLAQRIADALGLYSSPLMIQAIENENGISVIEFAARIGGGESFRLIKKSVQIDILDLAVDSFLGNRLNFDIKKPSTYYAENFIYAHPCCFDKLEGYEKLVNSGIIEYIDSNKERGSTISQGLTSNNRVGVFAVKGASHQELKEKILESLRGIQVIDCDGKNQIRSDIYKDLNS